METCDVLIAGGGPAGSTCAWALCQAGLDVVVADKAIFPRDKVCAGWITPQVVADLQLDVEEYRDGRTYQPFMGFRVGVVGHRGDVDAAYDHPVSYGIRRCEFDEYLLQRSGARLRLGAPVSKIRREGRLWTVGDNLTTPMLVGAGGHFCPVARLLNGSNPDAALVVAQETEFAIDPGDASSFSAEAERPELYFSRALNGYGWCVRKQNYLNVGFGHLDRRTLPRATAEFAAFLETERKIPRHLSCRWKGHAYLLSGPPRRQIVDDGLLLIGDAAGLAYPQSGEGIRTAVESGLIAAATILEARGRYNSAHLESYERRVRQRFGIGPASGAASQLLPRRLVRMMGPWLLRTPWFVRHVLVDRWFLHARESALSPAFATAGSSPQGMI
ncbi:MAG TPA: NAD(P)/FAD-dependent oxidoreductase [Vicinamibacterales bacterium]|nr:NAD(P)/FAD-dependent oxidoreductase [Vicinamibacterales bacterium]